MSRVKEKMKEGNKKKEETELAEGFPLHRSNYLSIQYTSMKDLTEWFQYTYLKELSVL